CIALARGPLVYCIEQADLPDDVTLEDLRIHASVPPVVNRAIGLPQIPVTLMAAGAVRKPTDAGLYPAAASEEAAKPITLTAVPYFLGGTRKPGPMRVWIPVAATECPLPPSVEEQPMAPRGLGIAGIAVAMTALLTPLTPPAHAADHTLAVDVG